MEIESTAVMTIAELSEYLHVPKSTFYRMAQDGRIPEQKVGRYWRVGKEADDRWLEENANSERRLEGEGEGDAGTSR